LASVRQRDDRHRVGRRNPVVPTILGQVELMAVGEPGELGGELVFLAERGVDGHGESALIGPHDLAFDAADMVDINHYAFADPSDDGRYQSRASRRNVGGLARIFVAILKHEAAEQVYPDALKAPSVM